MSWLVPEENYWYLSGENLIKDLPGKESPTVHLGYFHQCHQVNRAESLGSFVFCASIAFPNSNCVFPRGYYFECDVISAKQLIADTASSGRRQESHPRPVQAAKVLVGLEDGSESYWNL